MRAFDIEGRGIGGGARAFVIAEAGVNHNGRLDLALQLVDAAADAGADAVKFQTFRAELLASPSAPKAAYQQVSQPSESQLDMLRRLELDDAGHRAVQARARTRGLCFLSTPFEETSVDYLDALGISAFKVPSGELTNHPFLAHLAAKGKPLLLSTGMATMAEVADAIEAITTAADVPLALLQCVSRYPADPSEVNLRAMLAMREAFDVPVGYSDHTLGAEACIGAVALGAAVVEKHFTLDRGLRGPDHRASMEPSELRALIDSIRIVESALGDGQKRPVAGEAEIAAVARKSVVAVVDIRAGATIASGHVAIRRPGTGVSPSDLTRVIGRRASRDIAAGAPVAWSDLDGPHP